MIAHTLKSGRTVDLSCPFEGDCWGNQGCYQECPPTLLGVLRASARLEHECLMLPHTDPDIEEQCDVCPRLDSGSNSSVG